MVIGGMDDRLRIAPQLAKYRDQVGDPYRATRDFYLRRRQAEIDDLRGHPSKPTAKPPVAAPPASQSPAATAPVVTPAAATPAPSN